MSPIILLDTKGEQQPDDNTDVRLFFSGPRGGRRGYHSITREAAVALRDRLNEILSEAP